MRWYRRPERRVGGGKSGFTLLELLIVIAIISVLVALLLPALAVSRETARRTLCASRLKQWYLVYGHYAGDYQDFWPGVVSQEVDSCFSGGPFPDPVSPAYKGEHWYGWSHYYRGNAFWKSVLLMPEYGLHRVLTTCPSVTAPERPWFMEWGKYKPGSGFNFTDYLIFVGTGDIYDGTSGTNEPASGQHERWVGGSKKLIPFDLSRDFPFDLRPETFPGPTTRL